MIATTPTTMPKRRPATPAHVLAREVEARAAELAGFLDGADLPAELDLDTLASLAAADGLLAVAMQRIEANGPGGG